MIFSPGIYEHAAALIGCSPYEVSRSAHLLEKAHQTAWERYKHPLIVPGIDVYNLEPEAYGAKVKQPQGCNIPAINQHPCEEIEDFLNLQPLKPLENERIKEVIAAGKALKENCIGADIRIPLCGPFALAIGLLGMDELLMAVIEDPDELIQGISHLLTGQINYLNAINDAGLKPIFFESGTTPPLISTHHFSNIAAPLLKKIFAESHQIFNEHPSCIIGGDATPITRPLLEAKPGWVIAPSETDQDEFLKIAQNFPETHVRVNMSATCLISNNEDLIFAEAKRVRSLAESRSNTSAGCGVVPYETNPETIIKLRHFFENQS